MTKRKIIDRLVPGASLLIILLFFTAGLFGDCDGQYNKPDVIPSNVALFIKILLQNTGFAIFLLLGCFFLNITTVSLLIYTGISWGMSFKDLNCTVGLEKALIFVLPHIVLEITWIILACQLSVRISYQILDLFSDRTDAEEFYDEIKKKHVSSFFRILVLVLLGAVIESFVTPIFIN